MSGFVSFVGSGPGDPELLTLKAVDRLKRADAVLFDDLSAGPILSHVRAGADLIGVGKRAGRLSPKQHHVSRLLVEYAQGGGRIVRLKSGDSGLFGRLEEEQVALRAAAINTSLKRRDCPSRHPHTQAHAHHARKAPYKYIWMVGSCVHRVAVRVRV